LRGGINISVKNIDLNAFVIISEINEVLGEGFKDY